MVRSKKIALFSISEFLPFDEIFDRSCQYLMEYLDEHL